MSSNRAISPNEFRIKYRKFNIEYSPYNYFEKYRFELVLQNIGYWFYKYFGLYFYFQKIRIFENFVLIHFYYYKMHTHSIFSRKFQKDIKGRAVNDVDLLWAASRKMRDETKKYFYHPEVILNTRNFCDRSKKKIVIASERVFKYKKKINDWKFWVSKKKIYKTARKNKRGVFVRVFKLLSKKKWLRVKKMVLKMHQRLAIRAKFYNKVDFFDQLIITRKSKKRRRSVRRVLKKFYKKKKFNTSKKGFYRRLKKVGVKSKITDWKKFSWGRLLSRESAKRKLARKKVRIIKRIIRNWKKRWIIRNSRWWRKRYGDDVLVLINRKPKGVIKFNTESVLEVMNRLLKEWRLKQRFNSSQFFKKNSWRGCPFSEEIWGYFRRQTREAKKKKSTDKNNSIRIKRAHIVASILKEEKSGVSTKAARTGSGKNQIRKVKNEEKIKNIRFFLLRKHKTKKIKKYGHVIWRIKKKKKRKKIFKGARRNSHFYWYLYYFFYYFFKRQIILLFKSLFKSIITGKAYKKETRAVVRRMRFIKNKVKWWLDFSFLLNFSMTYSMNNLWYPLVLASLYTEKSHAHLIEKLFETLKTYYYLKITIKAMRISMTGTFDRHGRTQHKIFQLGEFELSNDKTFVVYDSLQVATTYGMTTVKFWVSLFSICYG